MPQGLETSAAQHRAPATARGPFSIASSIAAGFAVGLAVALADPAAMAQQSTTPAIADSPTAQTLFGDIGAQAKENPAESARIARRLLDEYGSRVIKVGAETDDLFTSVGAETERFLLENPAILARFRDMESRAAERMLAEEGPVATSARRRLTQAGLSATLMLAERAIRADQPRAARSLLAKVERHPDLAGASLVAWASLEAMACRRTGDAAGADAALARLDAVDSVDAAIRARARAAAVRTEPSKGSALGRSPLVSAPDGGDPDSTWREIWARELDQSLFRRLNGGMAPQRTRDLERARTDARQMAALPTVLGNRIFVSEGHRVRAVDVDSSDEIWSRDIGGPAIGRESAAIGDLSAIAADEGAVVTYEGHATPNDRTANPRVWCLDPATGAPLWTTVIDGCDGREDLAGLYPVGAPVLVADVVVVAARKPTQRLEQVDWLLALDRADGRLRWATSMAGAPANRLSIGRKLAGLVADGASVVLSTPLGAVASVRVSDGAIEWLRRFPVPLRESRFFSEPWEAASPIVAGQRILSITPDEVEIVALDPASGKLLEARPLGPGTPWETPAYLISAMGSDGTPIALGVGTDIVAFDARDLSKRLWSLAEQTKGIEPPRAGAANRNGIRGRVSVAGQFVVVPGVEEILLLDLRTGRVNARVPSGKPCNPLLLADRLVTAGDESLRVLMPSERAESMLRARLAATPDDPSAAIALLELAQVTGRPAVALDAGRIAEQALARGKGSEGVRRELMDKLVALAAHSPEQGDAAFAIIASICDTPLLRVRAEMARGEFLRTSGRAREAVACLRGVAEDPALASQLVEVEGVQRQVRLEALRRVAELGARDREISEFIESEARAAAARLTQSTAPALARFAELHARTKAAIDAFAATKDLEPDDALAVGSAMLGDLVLPPARIELIDALRADLAARSPDPAFRARLAMIDARVADLLHASGVDRPDLLASAPALPRLGKSPAAGFDLRARLPIETPVSRASRDQSLFLGLLDGSLVRLSGPELAPEWRLRLDDREPVVLWANGRAVLWQTLPKGDDNALIVDPVAGTIVYASPRAPELWPAAGGAQPDAQREAQRDAAPDFNRPRFVNTLPALIAPVCDGESLILVRRNGDLARIGVMDERPKAQLERGVVEQVLCESLRDGLLTIGGRRIAGDQERGAVAVLDARTLAVRHRIEPVSGSDVKWAFATALGEIFVGTRSGIERWVVGASGSPLPVMVSMLPESTEPDRPQFLGANLFTLDGPGRPNILPIFSGAPRAYAFPDGADSRQVRELVRLREGLLLQCDDRFVLLGPMGDAVGIDSNSREANFAFAVPVEGSVLQIIPLQPEGEQARIRYQAACVVERLSPTHGLKIEGGAFEVAVRDSRVQRVLAGNGWLLLSNSHGTMAVSLPP